MTEHAFWITSRAAGIVALLVATMVALAVHAFSLLGDSYLSPASPTSRSHSPAPTSGCGWSPAGSSATR
jgi:hypothetical protein